MELNDDIATFKRIGHYLQRAAIPRALICDNRDQFLEHVHDRHRELSQFEKSIGASAVNPSFDLLTAPPAVRHFVCSPELATIAASFLGESEVRVLHYNGFFKPGSGVATPWHQDLAYIPLDSDNVITLWIPLTSISSDMGSLVFAQGSHVAGPANMNSLHDQFKLVANDPMEIGDVSIHHGWTAHCSMPNQTERMREAIAISYFPDRVRIRLKPNSTQMSQNLLASCFPGLSDGDFAASPNTPLVYTQQE